MNFMNIPENYSKQDFKLFVLMEDLNSQLDIWLTMKNLRIESGIAWQI
jgi:hypothetical protein